MFDIGLEILIGVTLIGMSYNFFNVITLLIRQKKQKTNTKKIILKDHFRKNV